jgi:hypothetical protein
MQASETDHANDAEFDLVIDEAIDVLRDALKWVKTPAQWTTVDTIIDAMTDAVRRRDLVALRQATIDLEISGPTRLIPKDPPVDTGAKPALQRINHLIDDLDQAKSTKKPKDPSA